MKKADILAEITISVLQKKNNFCLAESVDVQELIDIAQRNHMEYILFSGIIGDSSIDDMVRENMRKRLKLSIARTLAQIQAIEQISASFEQNEIRHQPMKGAILKYLYPSPEIREMSDIDILVDADYMEEAARVMKQLGFSLAKSVKHHDIYVKGPFVLVEIHRALYDKTVDGNQYEYFKTFSHATLRDGCQFTYDFGHEDFYVYMMAHMAKHFYAMGCGIRNLLDVYMYLEAYGREMNRSYIEEELKKCGILDFTRHMEKLAYIWLAQKKSSPFYDDLFQYMCDSGIYGRDENGIWNRFADVKNLNASKSQLKKWYYFPPLSYMAEFYPWLETFPFLIGIAWLIRAFRGVVLHKGAEKKEMIKDIKQEDIQVYKNIYKEMGLHFKK